MPSLDYGTSNSWIFPKDTLNGKTVSAESDTDEDSSPNKIDSRIASSSNRLLVVASLGQEPRLGRWMKVSGGGSRNGVLMYAIPAKDEVRKPNTNSHRK